MQKIISKQKAFAKINKNNVEQMRNLIQKILRKKQIK